MNESVQEIIGPAWEDAGRRVAPSLDTATSALVVGDDPVAAAHAALGIARAQSSARRVAIADLVGGVPPLDDLVAGEDPHGITDSFEYGVSLSRIARQVDTGGTLFVMPSGSDPLITDDVLRSERWRLLADSYRKAGALLLLVAPAHAHGIDVLGGYVNGAVVVGDTDPRSLGQTRVLTVVGPPMSGEYTPIVTPALADQPERTAEVPRVEGTRRALGPYVPYLMGGLVGAAAAALLLGPRRAPEPAAPASTPVATAPATGTRPPVRRDDPDPMIGPPPTAATVATGALATESTPAAMFVVNPGDSIAASNYTVLLATFPSADRARTRLSQDSPDVPAATLAATATPTGPRHQYLAGAYTSRAQAESLLARLRRRGAVGARGGTVVRRPLGFLVRDGLPADSVPAVARGLASRGIPVYPLVQANGTVRLYSGAFESAEQAALSAAPLSRAGLSPTLAYRTGRPL